MTISEPLTEAEKYGMLYQAIQNLILVYAGALEEREELVNKKPTIWDWFINKGEPVEWKWSITSKNSHSLLFAEDALAGRRHNCKERGCYT